MASRSESKAQKAIDDLHRDVPTLERGSLVFVQLDLANLKSVVQAAESIKERRRKWTYLVNGMPCLLRLITSKHCCAVNNGGTAPRGLKQPTPASNLPWLSGTPRRLRPRLPLPSHTYSNPSAVMLVISSLPSFSCLYSKLLPRHQAPTFASSR